MKKFSFIFLSFLFAIAHGQKEIEVKQFAATDKDLGGEGIIKSSKLIEDKGIVTKTFEIEVQDDGDYYVAAWMMGQQNEKGLTEYDIAVNSAQTGNKVKAMKNNWHSAKLKDNKSASDGKIHLKKGTNTISYSCQLPDIPAIEFIKVSKDASKADISSKAYDDYIDTLKKHKLPLNYAEIKKAAIKKEMPSTLKSYKDDNPGSNGYVHEMALDFGYTFWGLIYLNGGGTVYTFETKNATCDPVMHLFFSDNPASASWTNDDGGPGYGYNSKITASINYSGYYYLFIRKWTNPSSVTGVCDLYMNGNLYLSNAAIAGSAIRCDRTVNIEMNYFTKLLSGDSRIWIEDNSLCGLIVGQNDDYNTSAPHDFQWGYASRVKQNFNRNIRSVIVSSYSSGSGAGLCDLYMNLPNATINSSRFPLLKANDAIQTSTNEYNCFAWSGGITNLPYVWPAEPDNPWHDITEQKSFDNYYANVNSRGESLKRFPTAPSYTRTGATLSNAVIALWNIPAGGNFTHASITKPGNNMPHGYDWESKLSRYEDRTMHPRDALTNPDVYGSIVVLYTSLGSLKSASIFNEEITFDESIERGLMVPDNTSYSVSQKIKIQKIIGKLSNEKIERFNNLFLYLEDANNSEEYRYYNTPVKIQKSKEYLDLLAFFNNEGEETWCLLYDKIENENYLARLLLCDISLPKYEKLLNEARNESFEHQYNEKGAYIQPSSEANAKKYVKNLLETTDNNGKLKIIEEATNVDIITQNSFSLFPNPVKDKFSIEFDAAIQIYATVELHDIFLRKISVLKQDQQNFPGKHQINIDVSTLKQGIYLCNIIVDKQSYVYKVIKE